MPETPKISSYDLKDGLWFIFYDNETKISYWNSSVSGKEKIYINDILFSEKINLTLSSENIFDYNGVKYKLTYNCNKRLQDIYECRFYKNDSFVKKFAIRLSFNKQRPVYAIILSIGFGLFMDLAYEYFQAHTYPFYQVILFITLILIFLVLIVCKFYFLIEVRESEIDD